MSISIAWPGPFLAAVLALALATGAEAATAGANLNVQATVVDACSVADATLDFGQVNPTTGVVAPAVSTISVTCSLGTAFAVGLGDGLNSSGGQRRMRRGASSDYLQYELYKDLLTTARFGDADVNDRLGGLLGLGLAPTTVVVYGAIPPSQAGGAGAYADTVQITVYF